MSPCERQGLKLWLFKVPYLTLPYLTLPYFTSYIILGEVIVGPHSLFFFCIFFVFFSLITKIHIGRGPPLQLQNTSKLPSINNNDDNDYNNRNHVSIVITSSAIGFSSLAFPL